MITSSKCRPRNSAGRRRVTVHRTRSAQAAFATEPSIAAARSWTSTSAMKSLATRIRRPEQRHVTAEDNKSQLLADGLLSSASIGAPRTGAYSVRKRAYLLEAIDLDRGWVHRI